MRLAVLLAVRPSGHVQAIRNEFAQLKHIHCKELTAFSEPAMGNILIRFKPVHSFIR